jgi:hypothetical protein
MSPGIGPGIVRSARANGSTDVGSLSPAVDERTGLGGTLGTRITSLNTNPRYRWFRADTVQVVDMGGRFTYGEGKRENRGMASKETPRSMRIADGGLPSPAGSRDATERSATGGDDARSGRTSLAID